MTTLPCVLFKTYRLRYRFAIYRNAVEGSVVKAPAFSFITNNATFTIHLLFSDTFYAQKQAHNASSALTSGMISFLIILLLKNYFM